MSVQYKELEQGLKELLHGDVLIRNLSPSPTT